MKLSQRNYNNIHQWVGRKYQKLGICERCGETCKTHWSNMTGNYSRDRFDWQELCPRCHNFYDRNVLGVKFGRRKGMKRKEKLAPVPEGFSYLDLLRNI